MNKIYGNVVDYKIVYQDRARVVVCYGMQPEADGVHATWYECQWYKKQHRVVTIDDAKTAIIDSINTNTDTQIREGHVWNDKQVWLSSENQFNYKAAYDLAVQSYGASLPVTFKFGTDEAPEYHEFTSLDELSEFYLGCVKHINDTLEKGWVLKDTLDWKKYEDALAEIYA